MVLSCFCLADHPPIGAEGDLGVFVYSDCGTGLCDFVCSNFLANSFPVAPLRQRCGATSVLGISIDTPSPRAPCR